MTRQVTARSAGVEWQVVDGEVVILDLRTSCYLGLNRAGATLWPLVVAGTSPEALAATLVATYGIAPGAATRDVDVLLGQLADARLLEEGSDAAAEPV